VIAFLALVLSVVVQSIRLERERRRVAVFADRLAAERERAQASLRHSEALRDRLQAHLAAQGSETGSGPANPGPATK
jgi:hypothetical protein